MSKKDHDKQPNNSFEDAMRKIVTTKVDPAIMIEGVGVEYEIPNVASKKVKFTKIEIENKDVSLFAITVIVKNEHPTEPELLSYYIKLPISSSQLNRDSVSIEHSPVPVRTDFKLTLMVNPAKEAEKEIFEVGSLSYKVLD